MRLLNAALAAIAFLFLASPVSAEIEPALSPIVDIQTSGGVHICSGFYVGNGKLVTASHCVNDYAPGGYKARFTDGTVVDIYIGVIADVDRKFDDFAIMIFQEPKKKIRPMPLHCGLPAIGDVVIMEGYPMDMGYTKVWGRVSGEAHDWGPWPHVFGVNLAAINGFSGAAVQNEKGEVVGILVGGPTRNLSLAVAVPMTKVCAMLDVEAGA